MSEQPQHHLNHLAWKILPWMADVLCAFLVWWAVQINSEIRAIRTELSELREFRATTLASRYTTLDAQQHNERQTAELTKLWAKIADIQQQWLRDLSDIKSSISRIEAQIDVDRRAK
jgi:hypothetical protein